MTVSSRNWLAGTGRHAGRHQEDEALARWRREQRTDQVWRAVLPVLVFAGLAAAWQYASAYSGSVGGVLVPSFTQFAVAVGQVFTSGGFWSALWTSESALLLGFAAAAVTGVPLGLLIGRRRDLDALVIPYLDMAVVVPLAILTPMVLVIFGPTLAARVAIIFVFALPFVAVPCRAGAMVTPPELISMARSYGASALQVWREVLLPSAVPAILTGLRQGLAHALTGMIIIELTFLAVGLGQLLQEYQGKFDAAAVFGLVFLIIAQGVLLMAALHAAESRFRRRTQT
jgi:NitT/TauT family transport system permease protein